jgi:CRISPR-associated protein Cas1
MSSLLLVDEDGALLRRKDEHFVVSLEALDLMSVPYVDIDCIVLAGFQEVTRGALELALSRGIPVYFMTRNGKLQGSVTAPIAPAANIRAAQYHVLEDSEQRMRLARCLLGAQMRNQRALLRRLALRRDGNAVLVQSRKEIKVLQKTLGTHASIEELRGVEGRASRLVFEGLRSILDSTLGFTVRAVRSDRDPLNCALDACGGLLAATCKGAIEAAGLDPYRGVFHGSARNGPALALDLEDVFRPLLVTATSVTLFTKAVLGQADFVIAKNSCRLTAEGFAKVCRLFGSNLHREVIREPQQQSKTYIRHIFEDARQLAGFFRDAATAPEFFTVR